MGQVTNAGPYSGESFSEKSLSGTSFGARTPSIRGAAPAQKAGFFSRMLAALIAARSEQAEREVQCYLRAIGRADRG